MNLKALELLMLSIKINVFFLLGFVATLTTSGNCWSFVFAQNLGEVSLHEEPLHLKETTDVGSSTELSAAANSDKREVRKKQGLEKRDVKIVFDEYQTKLEELAKKCDELEMPLEARITRSLIYSTNSEVFTVPLLPAQKTPKTWPDDASKNQRFWFSALNRLRDQYSNEIFTFAERFGEEKRGYDVVACALTTLFVNPDHEKARKFFNYTLQDGVWRSKWELRQQEKGLVETPDFGWLPVDNVERYRKGERFYKRQWISAQEEKEKILASASGWRIDTEHFSILSRVSLERGVEIGRLLEAYYQAWSRLFFRVIASEAQP